MLVTQNLANFVGLRIAFEFGHPDVKEHHEESKLLIEMSLNINLETLGKRYLLSPTRVDKTGWVDKEPSLSNVYRYVS